MELAGLARSPTKEAPARMRPGADAPFTEEPILINAQMSGPTAAIATRDADPHFLAVSQKDLLGL